MNFSGKTAFVTGASSGIGKSIAENLMLKGAKVFCTATNQNNVDKINNFLKNKGHGIVIDFSNFSDLQKKLNSNIINFQDIDILINNAAITYDKLFIRNNIDDWQKIININLISIFLLSKYVIKGMIKKRFGRIISIGSIVGSTGNIGQTIYSSTKAGLVGFSKSLAREVSSRGITVNVVSPGFIETNMIKKLTKQQKENILSKIPLCRLGTAQEVANAVLFLASNEASYITGETLNVNGGMNMI